MSYGRGYPYQQGQGYQQQQQPYRAGNPQGYASAPRGYAPAPGSYAPAPRGYAPAPGGYASAPRGYAPAPGAYAPPRSQMPAQGPPPGVRPDIWQWFKTVDQDNSGTINCLELQKALVNGNFSQFNEETCRMMIGMFDANRNGTIDIHEFSKLWDYIQQWKQCFESFDTDRFGSIDADELHRAFSTFGYRLSKHFSELVVRKFDRMGVRRAINFDDFIQACVLLKSLTDGFRKCDTNQTGVVQLNYEQFLEIVIDNTIQ